uniref:Uncharacterized protein n=1 Tax=Phlebotomus papatasi TaxID=29031 RepID=A0A1B0DE49_PHLPP
MEHHSKLHSSYSVNMRLNYHGKWKETIPTIPVEDLPPQQTTKQVPPKVVVVKHTPNLHNDETTSDASCSTSVEMMDMENNLEIPETGSGINILEVKSTASVMLEERSAQQRRNMENEKLELMKEIEEKTIELQRLQGIEEELTQLKGKAEILKKVKEHLQRQVTSLKSTNEQLMKIKQEKENMENILLETFSQNELDLLLKRKSHVAWKRKEIEEAFLIQYLSKRCYKYLRTKKRYPLPSLQIIQKWTNQHGIQLEVLNNIESDSD